MRDESRIFSREVQRVGQKENQPEKHSAIGRLKTTASAIQPRQSSHARWQYPVR